MTPGIPPRRDLPGISAPHPPAPHTDPALKDPPKLLPGHPGVQASDKDVPVTCCGGTGQNLSQLLAIIITRFYNIQMLLHGAQSSRNTSLWKSGKLPEGCLGFHTLHTSLSLEILIQERCKPIRGQRNAAATHLSAEPPAILLPSGDQEHLRRF